MSGATIGATAGRGRAGSLPPDAFHPRMSAADRARAVEFVQRYLLDDVAHEPTFGEFVRILKRTPRWRDVAAQWLAVYDRELLRTERDMAALATEKADIRAQIDAVERAEGEGMVGR